MPKSWTAKLAELVRAEQEAPKSKATTKDVVDLLASSMAAFAAGWPNKDVQSAFEDYRMFVALPDLKKASPKNYAELRRVAVTAAADEHMATAFRRAFKKR